MRTRTFDPTPSVRFHLFSINSLNCSRSSEPGVESISNFDPYSPLIGARARVLQVLLEIVERSHAQSECLPPCTIPSPFAYVYAFTVARGCVRFFSKKAKERKKKKSQYPSLSLCRCHRSRRTVHRSRMTDERDVTATGAATGREITLPGHDFNSWIRRRAVIVLEIRVYDKSPA